MYATLTVNSNQVTASEVTSAAHAVQLWYNRYAYAAPGMYAISLWSSKRAAFSMLLAAAMFAVGPTPSDAELEAITAMVV